MLSVLAPARVFEILVGISLFSALATWAIIFATHLAFRRQRTDRERSPIRLRGGPAVPLIAIALILSVMATMAFVAPFELAPLAGLPFLAALLLAHAAIRRRHGRMAATTRLES
ncbi:hypothetical protein [Streptomyces sp. 8N706]|uniref:hypothetical protein n=1 Tax=Streptomyces sp. 8N706 TaxID=3457416 RepID=UPI003FD07760